MVGATLLDFVAAQYAAGQRQLAECTRQLVSMAQTPIVELLDYSNETVFLEPTLFTFFGRRESKVTLEQILYGKLPDRSSLATFAAYADHGGLIYLPQLGYLTTDVSDSVVTVDSDVLARGISGLRRVCNSRIDLCMASDPLLRPILQDADEQETRIEEDAAEHYSVGVDRAFETIGRVAPLLFECLLAVTRRVALFRSEKLGSFADIAAHGTAFLNVAPPDVTTEVFFVEDLAHQCGHILFSAMTVNREDYLRASPTTPLKQLTGADGERRDVYTAFHGVFTEALMCIALTRCLETRVFSEEKLHEVLGRLSFVMKRFELDLLNLQHVQNEGLFTACGLTVVHECGSVFDEVFRCTADRIIHFDLSNQPYTFSCERFAALNPRH
jgi:hypothetical protein